MAKFEKGWKGGPGRPKLSETERQAKQIAKGLAGEAMDTLAFIMRSAVVKDEDGKTIGCDHRLAAASARACEAIVDRADGKPKQEIEHSGSMTQNVITDTPRELTTDSWLKQHARPTIQ